VERFRGCVFESIEVKWSIYIWRGVLEREMFYDELTSL
jgi:hypothetical protein